MVIRTICKINSVQPKTLQNKQNSVSSVNYYPQYNLYTSYTTKKTQIHKQTSTTSKSPI